MLLLQDDVTYAEQYQQQRVWEWQTEKLKNIMLHTHTGEHTLNKWINESAGFS